MQVLQTGLSEPRYVLRVVHEENDKTLQSNVSVCALTPRGVTLGRGHMVYFTEAGGAVWSARRDGGEVGFAGRRRGSGAL